MSFIVPFGIAFLAISMIAIGIILIIRTRGVGKNSPRNSTIRQNENDPALTGALSIVVGVLTLVLLSVGMLSKL